MNNLKLLLFCFFFTVVAVWAQHFLPRMDFLSPGLVVLLQFGLIKPALWASLAWMLIQEGTGGLSFGTMILFYLGLAVLYYLGGVIFEAGNFLFITLLFLLLSVFKVWIVSVMASLQGLELAGQFSVEGILFQAGIYFAVWLLTYNLFKLIFGHGPVQGKHNS